VTKASFLQYVKSTSAKTAFLCVVIFFVAAGVRLLHFQDNQSGTPLAGMEAGEPARSILAGNIGEFLRGPNPPNNAAVLIRPPGYTFLVAVVFKVFGSSDNVMRVFQLLCDAAAAMFVFLIALQLLPLRGAAIIAGLLVAIAPQLAYYSSVLLPDSMVILPVLGAVYTCMKLIERPRLLMAVVTGALVGLSLWLRANTMMLAPFLAVPVFFLARRRDAFVLVAVMILVVAPITIRNWVVFHHFIPVGLGAGVTLIEGIGAYDRDNRFGLPASDMGICRWEAVLYNRPDYVERLFQPGGPSILTPDGIEREQKRVKIGWSIIRSNPFWFARVMVRRATNMLRMERINGVAIEPAVTHSLASAGIMPAVWSGAPAQLASTASNSSPRTRFALITQGPVPLVAPGVDQRAAQGDRLRIESDEFRKDDQIVVPAIQVESNNDYLLKIPIKVDRDGIAISVISGASGAVLATTTVYQWMDTPAAEQPVSVVQVPFVSRDTNSIRIVFGDFNQRTTKPALELGKVELFRLGAAAQVWTRWPRLIVHAMQKLFLTAIVLPLMILGLALMVIARRTRDLMILLAVPAYYMCFQSILHTDYRHVLPIYYFTFMLVALGLTWIGVLIWQGGRRLVGRGPQPSRSVA
jgi:hypothetical protein